jgi:multidrug efflux pump subunit AcrB
VEDAIQRMEQIKYIKMSISRPGMSDILIQFKDKYKPEDFPGIYDELRRKITDMEHKLPPVRGRRSWWTSSPTSTGST